MTRLLGPAGTKEIEARGLSIETAARLGIYTAKYFPDMDGSGKGAILPSEAGDIIAFPFWENEQEVNCKFRGKHRQTGLKTFIQTPGGRRTFYNSDVMDDPALLDGRAPLIIVEGEFDCVAALDAGLPLTVSVPDGAPSVPKDDPLKLDPLDPKTESEGKFQFLFNNKDRLKKIKRYVIAVDADIAGERLAAELVRRLGAFKCSFVVYPKEPVVQDGKTGKVRGCKDMNEVLQHFGAQACQDLIAKAQPFPVRGLYKLSDYKPRPKLQTFTNGWTGAEDVFKLFLGAFIVVTGMPGSGKSRWVLDLLYNVAVCHGWTSAICSPEMPVVPMLRDRFRARFIGRRAIMDENDLMAADEAALVKQADDFIERFYSFIEVDQTAANDNEDTPFDIDFILDRATDAVLRDGIRILVIDPFNELDHSRGKGETETEYVGRVIRLVKRWAQTYGVIVIIIAHPTKEVAKDGTARVPTPYDISGGANWYNKADFCVVVDREDRDGTGADAYLKKVKFQEECGPERVMLFNMERESGRYEFMGAVVRKEPRADPEAAAAPKQPRKRRRAL